MADSMTGYGRAEKTIDSRRFLVEVKTVNNRFCDVQLRMPRMLLPLEIQLKEKVSKRLLRGKADVYITLEDMGAGNASVVPDLALAQAYSEAVSQIASATGRTDDGGASYLARLPDVMPVRTIECEPEDISDSLYSVLDEALDAIAHMRQTEGDRLAIDIINKIDALYQMQEEIAKRSSLVPAEYREKLKARMEELLTDTTGLYFDEGRREAEVAIFADRCSIDEELTRLQSHMGQFRTTLAAPGSIGKRLDFIVQEINREVNTIGSKANDLTITNLVLDMKTELEKIREQIQNLA